MSYDSVQHSRPATEHGGARYYKLSAIKPQGVAGRCGLTQAVGSVLKVYAVFSHFPKCPR